MPYRSPMDKTMTIAVIVLVAVVMGMSSVVPSVQAFSLFTQTLPDQIAEENGIDLDGVPKQCQKACAVEFRLAVTACKAGDTDCIQAAVADLKKCIAICREGPPDL